jgi:hypothetical protein
VVRVLKIPDAIRDGDAPDMRSGRTRTSARTATNTTHPLGPSRIGRAAASVVAAGSREKLPVVDLGAVNENVRVGVGRDRELRVAHELADLGPRLPAQVEQGDAAVA